MFAGPHLTTHALDSSYEPNNMLPVASLVVPTHSKKKWISFDHIVLNRHDHRKCSIWNNQNHPERVRFFRRLSFNFQLLPPEKLPTSLSAKSANFFGCFWGLKFTVKHHSLSIQGELPVLVIGRPTGVAFFMSVLSSEFRIACRLWYNTNAFKLSKNNNFIFWKTTQKTTSKIWTSFDTNRLDC